jgi:hypothetical protein
MDAPVPTLYTPENGRFDVCWATSELRICTTDGLWKFFLSRIFGIAEEKVDS